MLLGQLYVFTLFIRSLTFSSGRHDRIASKLTKLGQPFGILMSIGSCWFFGFIILIVIAACINPDLSSVIQSPFGQPMAQASGP